MRRDFTLRLDRGRSFLWNLSATRAAKLDPIEHCGRRPEGRDLTRRQNGAGIRRKSQASDGHLRTHKMRSGLTVFGVVLGVA